MSEGPTNPDVREHFSQRKLWFLVCTGLLAVQVMVNATYPAHSFVRQAFSDLLQVAVVTVVTLVFFINTFRSEGYARLFWGLLAFSGVLWVGIQLIWATYEVVLRKDVPDLFLGDSLTFLHIVPMMGALGVQPHLKKEGETRPGGLDFTLLLLWWVYLYVFMVLPWQYISQNLARYNIGFDVLYTCEYAAFLAGSGYLIFHSTGAWRRTYGRMFVAAAAHAAATLALNRAIDLKPESPWSYYSGSWYDVPFVATLMLWVWAAAGSNTTTNEGESEWEVENYGVWAARIAMAAVLSLPMMALFALFDSSLPPEVMHFRVIVTAVAFFVLTFLIFLKQSLLDERLIYSLRQSRLSFDNLQKLQSHLVQAEKLASIGRLVAGAAHEINNPLTAILGYSDLLAGHHELEDEHKQTADKIRQQARRTKNLVTNLIAFAKQAPQQHLSVDLNAVVQRSLTLRELDFAHKKIRTVRELDDALPPIWGDENHLLQVCLHLFSNAVDAMEETRGMGLLEVSTSQEDGRAVLRCADNGPGIAQPEHIFDPFYTTKPLGKGTGLGLSACYGIIRDHRGEIRCENRPEGGARFTIYLPLAETIAPATATTTTSGK